MNKFIILLISVLIIKFLLIRYVRKKYNIVPYPGSYRPINHTHKWVDRILLLLAIVWLLLAYIVDSLLFILPLVVVMFLYLVFNAFMEYKHEKEEKEYIVTLIDTFFFSVLFIGASFLYFGGHFDG